MKFLLTSLFSVYSAVFAFSTEQYTVFILILFFYTGSVVLKFLKKWQQVIKNYTFIFLMTMVTGLSLVTHIKHFVFQPFLVKNKSMVPFLKPGDYVIIDKISMGLIINFYEPNLPVYRIEFPLQRRLKEDDVVVLVNPVNKDVVIKRIKSIEKSKYCVYGDNPEHSFDSRDFGCVPPESIIGRMIYHYKTPSRQNGKS